jgi:hypothetical protein
MPNSQQQQQPNEPQPPKNLADLQGIFIDISSNLQKKNIESVIKKGLSTISLGLSAFEQPPAPLGNFLSLILARRE